MSLHALAGHMASKGRGSDSMLVHMTPEEVQSLQVLALKGGGTLTINPDTGLPEANFLKKMLPMLAGLALAPLTAGTSLAFLGATPLAAAMTVGGITGLATGSLSRGLMAGLGAYGGASLGAGLANAGTSALASSGAPIAENVASTVGGQGALVSVPPIEQINPSNFSFSAADKLSAGAQAAFTDPKSVVTAMGGPAKAIGATYAAVSPMLADEGVKTTTQRPDTGMIRNFTFDPYGQTYTSAGDYPASEYQGRNMAQGGIVALAEGGGLKLPEGWGTAGGKYDNPNEKIEYFNQQGITPAQLLASNQGVTQADIDWMQTQGGYNVPNPVTQVSNAPATSNLVLPEGWGTAGGAYDTAAEKIGYFNQQNIMPEQLLNAGKGVTQADIDWMRTQGRYAPNIGTYLSANPNLTYTDINSLVTQLGLTPEQAKKSMADAGLSGAVQYAAFNPDIGAASNVSETYGGLKGLSSNINYWLDTHPGASLNEFRNQMSEYLLDENDIKRATGKTSAELFTGKLSEVYNPAEGASGSTGAGAIGGGTVVNPNGTITTSPRIPGIPEGGFTGMGNVRDVYTEGGGSTGYVNKAPTTMEEFEQRFNKQTGDSLAAYNYLMGKGANPVKSGVEQIMRPYKEVVTGLPVEKNAAGVELRSTQKYIFDPVEKKYVENPNYAPMSFNSKGERKVGLSSSEVLKGFQALPAKSDDAAIFDWVDKNNITLAQLAAAMKIPLAEAQRRKDAAAKKKTDAEAAATAPVVVEPAANGGVMRMAAGGYAVGGGLGALAGGGSTSQYNLGGYSDGGRLLRGPGDGVSDSIPATIGNKQPARLADGEFVVPARIVSELGNGSTEAGARKLYAMMDRVQKARGKTTGKNRVAANTRSDKYLPA